MRIRLKRYSRRLKIDAQLKKLYLTAFPDDERAPYFLLMHKAKKGKAEMLIAYDEDEFIGFAYLVRHGDMVYLFYFAVDEEKRGMGYGGRILGALKKVYVNERLFLAREQLDETAENFTQRESRHRFYLRCGFKDLPLMIKEAEVIYDVMGIGGAIAPEEYEALMTSWSGKLLQRLVDMRLIEKSE